MVRRLLATLALCVLTADLLACTKAGADDPAGHAAEGSPRVALETPEAKETLGEDDGFNGAIFYGGEMVGSIDDCGCPAHPQGGLPWRMGYTEGFRSAYPDAGYLQVDGGGSMSAVMDRDGHLFSDSVVKSDWVLKALGEFNFDAANISYDDIYYLSQYLRAGGEWDKAVAAHPMLARYVSANLEPARQDLVAPPPYVVRSLTGKRVPGGSFRVAFIGLTETRAALTEQTGFKVADPKVALGKVLDKARSESDAVVVLAYMNDDEVKPLVEAFPGKIDAYVLANNRVRDKEPVTDGPARMLFARYQTRQLGELRLFLDDAKHIAKVENRYVVLDEKLPKDPKAEQMAAAAKEDVRRAQEARFNGNIVQPTPEPGIPVAPRKERATNDGR